MSCSHCFFGYSWPKYRCKDWKVRSIWCICHSFYIVSIFNACDIGIVCIFMLYVFSQTNSDGRCPTLLPEGYKAEKGIYRVTFETKAFFSKIGQYCFYPYVQVSIYFIFWLSCSTYWHAIHRLFLNWPILNNIIISLCWLVLILTLLIVVVKLFKYTAVIKLYNNCGIFFVGVTIFKSWGVWGRDCRAQDLWSIAKFRNGCYKTIYSQEIWNDENVICLKMTNIEWPLFIQVYNESRSVPHEFVNFALSTIWLDIYNWKYKA